MTSIANFPDENSKFTNEFEEYRRACREKYQQQKPQQIIEEVEENSSEAEDDGIEASLSEDELRGAQCYSPSLKDARFSVSPAPVSETCNATSEPTTPASPVAPLRSSTDQLRSSAGAQRRNSLGKIFSNMFKKSGGGSESPKPSLRASQDSPKARLDKEKLKAEKAKAEQDFRMARFIAELEFEGKSDQEIQMHLFHIRDQAQFARPRSNSVGEWFRGMHQAFKDEFSARKCVTVHVSTTNPFAAAAPTNYVHDLGYSYEDLLTLEPVPRGLKSTSHLPTCVYEGQELPSSQTTCAICMADFEVTEDLRALNCTHHFHTECIDKWLGVATTCPVCKCDVVRE